MEASRAIGSVEVIGMESSTAELAARAGIVLIECARDLGWLRSDCCAQRSLVAQGRIAGDIGIRDSVCRGCPAGEARAADPNFRLPERDFKPGRGGQNKKPKIWAAKPKKEPKPPTIRTCGLESCGIQFEVKGVADANRKYHAEACRLIAQDARAAANPNPKRRRARPPMEALPPLPPTSERSTEAPEV
jgi:hypothetical protein